MKRIFLIYFLVFVFFSIIYLSLFHTSLFNFQKVLFYRGLGLLFVVIALFFIFGFIYFFKYSKKNIESIIGAITISAAIHLSIFVVFPVTFERSVTMYLLNVLSKKHMTKTELENNLIKEYIIKKKAVDKRIIEQKIIRLIKDRQNSIQLTQYGLNFLKFSTIIKKIYGI